MLRKCYWKGALNCPPPPTTLRLVHFLFLLPCPWSLRIVQISDHMSPSPRGLPWVPYLKQTNFYLNLSLSHNLLYFPHSTHCNLRFSRLTHLIISLAGMWITGGQGPGLFVFALSPRCLEQWLVYSRCSINIWMKLYLFGYWLIPEQNVRSMEARILSGLPLHPQHLAWYLVHSRCSRISGSVN